MNPFYGTKGSRTAKIFVCGESYGRTETREQRPFVGESGQDLDKLFNESGLSVNDCFYSNVVNEQPPNNDMSKFFHSTKIARESRLLTTNGLYPHENVLQGLDNLRTQILTIKPKVIIGLGNYTLWALTNDKFSIGNDGGTKIPTGITQWRGSQLYTSPSFGSIPFLPTYHPAAALRTYPWRYMIKHDLKTRVKLAFDPNAWKEPDYDFILRPNLNDVVTRLNSFLERLAVGKLKLSWDLETRSELIACVGIADSPIRAICIPLLCEENDSGYWNQAEEFIIVALLREILAHKNLVLIGQNFLYDIQYLIDQMFVYPSISFDTMIAHHTVWPGGGDPNDPTSNKGMMQGIQKKALYNLSSLYCKHHTYWKDEGKNWSKESEDVLWNYNCKDAVKTFEIEGEIQDLITSFDLQSQFNTQMLVANKVVLPMMVRGIKTDIADRIKVAEELRLALENLDARMAPIVPESIIPTKKGSKPWYRSPTKQKTLFYDILGVSPVFGKDKKTPTTSKEALPIIGQREPILIPVINLLELRRSLGVYYSTFAEAKAEADGRMRCSYSVPGTDTFRLSSSENIYGRAGNMQNIPSGNESTAYNFPNMRKAFTPDVGYEIGEFDLAGADAQVVAWEANDSDLKDAFRKGLKLHIHNVRMLYPERTKDMTDEELKATDHSGGIYHNSKRRVHGTNYGAQPGTFVTKLRTSLSEEQEFHERWFHLHPGIKDWHNRTNRQLSGLQCWKCNTLTGGTRVCSKCGAIVGRTVGNKFGYRIVYFDRINDLFTKALAWTPQSTVAINTNKGAIALAKYCPWVELLLQVHDSLIVQWPIKYSDRLDEVKKALYTVTVPYSDPLTIGWGCKLSRISWGHAEPIKW